MSRTILIDVALRDVREVEISDRDEIALADMRGFVGGGIELAWVSHSGDVLYVNRDWGHGPRQHFFQIDGSYPIGSNGLFVGPDRPRNGSFPVSLSVPEACQLVAFLDRAGADAWIAAHADEPAVQINNDVIQTRAQWWAEVMALAAREDLS